MLAFDLEEWTIRVLRHVPEEVNNVRAHSLLKHWCCGLGSELRFCPCQICVACVEGK
jgi:hypothetical protein